MANHKSAKKRARQTITRTARNRARTSGARTVLKAIRLAISENDKKVATELLPKVQAKLRKLAQTGIIKLNTAARKTSRLASQINGL
ncbi:MAG: 30S ribosomal protein S20 [Halobacteriovoraceae bacterium]|nr:30S ribosomal protein S20 [Halobacteriovoraceae bacterium]MBT5092982.1 30S ribosomal protein S20 [Halobacteriovoraceae bacterium]